MFKKLSIGVLFILLFLCINVVSPLFAIERSISTPGKPETPNTPEKPETPKIKKIEFIHYPRYRRSPRIPNRRRIPTKSPKPTPSATPIPTLSPTPTPVPTFEPAYSCPDPLYCNIYNLGPLKLEDPNGLDNLGVSYYTNFSDQSGLSIKGLEHAIDSSFKVWENANSSKVLRFKHAGATSAQAGFRDRQNTISFRNLKYYRGALAVTSIWYRSDTRKIIEFDIIFNNNVSWRINPWPSNCSEYPINTCIGDILTYDFENVAVHEIGHTLLLYDLYKFKQTELTMYGRAKKGEMKKRTLGKGDITGLNLLYP